MLKGIRIIDFTQYLPGPFSTLRLADLGAEVIKVEPLHGDPAREMGTNESDFLFSVNNRNKKSIAINVKEKVGQQLARELIEQGDVVIESFRPGVMKRLGLDYTSLKKYKENLIYLSLTGFGQDGSLSQLGSHDLNYLALSGVLNQFQEEDGPPTHPTITLADLIGGMAASEAILGALLQRERTGKGTYIDLAILDVLLGMIGNHAAISHLTGHRHGLPVLDSSMVNYHLYETKDHRYMSLGALEFKFWRNFCLAVECPEWVEAYPSKLKISNSIYEQVKQLFLTRTQEEWIRLGEAHDCCLFPVLDVEEAVSSTYVKQRELMQLVGNTPFLFTQTYFNSSVRPSDASVHLGEHTEEILTHLLHKQKGEIREWCDQGIVLAWNKIP
ncbi:CaiB/BaiF CoA-transferase family protein [Bacillaceae bacterium S4-13-56]